MTARPAGEALKEAHLTPADLDRLAGYRGEKVLNRILLHHLTVCSECREVGGFLLDAYDAGELMYGELPGFRIALARSRSEAAGLWLELSGMKLKRQKAMVRKAKRLQSWGLAELLCRKSLEAAAGEPAAAERLAELAVEVAMLVRDFDDPNDESWVKLLRGFAWAHLGKARRSLGDFEGSRVAFDEAKELWEKAFANAGDVLGYESGFRELLRPVRTKGRRRSPEKAS
ncbi:MAG TPA: hypothetical protein VH988_01470 [Thermoanaerobaculia bacterium]|nr:hypothetical protein [Thermoanaerobaculia bacterium]